MRTREPLSPDGTVSTVPSGQLTAENRSLEVGDVSFVYRRFGNERTDAPPLVCLQHFRGNLDSWDPALVDRLAQDREVILVDNRGVGGSTGVVPDNVTDMARDALAFIDALGLDEVDVLGFSLGGYVAQELTLLRPRLVRRLVLAATAPQGGPDLHRWSDTVFALATADQPAAEGLLGLFFSPSEASRAKGMEYLQRAYQRQEDRDAPTDLATRDAQLTAITAWGIPDASRLNRLAGITQPTLVANGDDDQMMHTTNSHLLAEQLPNAELRIYPDANHGFLDQYPELFADDIVAFLNREPTAPLTNEEA
jgi:pimeloyl-ACP methyl ester carboxylesterase